jgi:hypothetical protein
LAADFGSAVRGGIVTFTSALLVSICALVSFAAVAPRKVDWRVLTYDLKSRLSQARAASDTISGLVYDPEVIIAVR